MSAPPIQWNYRGNPATNPEDEVRFRLGDTNPSDPMLADGEVAYLLQQAGGDAVLAALYGAEGLLLRFSYAVDESVGSVSISFSQRMANLKEVIATLRTRVAMTAGVPYGGGISKADVDATNANPDRVPPRFYRDVLSSPAVIDGDLGRGERFMDPLLGGQNG